MKIKSSILSLCIIILSMMVIQCSNDTTSDQKATIQLKLIDAEGDYDKVLVNIIDVLYNASDDEGWVSFEGFEKPETDDPENRIDLTELIAGNSVVLTDQQIEAGTLNQIRLLLGDGNALVLEGSEEEIALDTPSAQQSGLKLLIDTELEAGYSYTFILDWDVQESIVKAGNSGKYNLNPVIRVMAEVNSGIISGRVADILETEENADPMPLENAVITAYDSTDNTYSTPIASSYSNAEGLFQVQGLAPGTYNIRVSLAGYTSVDVEGINVEAGVDTALSDTVHLTQE